MKMLSHSLENPLILLEADIEGGGKDDHDNDIHSDAMYLSSNVENAVLKIRMAFIRKVYALLSVQLLITVAVASTFYLVEPVKYYVTENMWPVTTSFLLTFVILIALYFKRRDHPINLILLISFTVVMSSLVGTVVSVSDAFLVLEAVFITLTVVITLTVFTFQTKMEFSATSTGLITALDVLIIGGLLQIFIQSSFMELLLCVGGTMLFSFFIIFDTQLIMKTLSPEEYILGTINIYLDIINLFLYILRLLAIARK